MNLNTTIKRGENYLHNEVDNELVMMNVNTGGYVSLNDTGKFIWHFLESPKTYQEIMDCLFNTYNVTKEQFTTDLVPFLEKMLDEKIIEISTK
ncbi:PqqD family protein [Pedobacter changchengzhani]|uniref:PqqD family protein n=1 Tax=Pedobacter changchengzhani TaxID=2529274 RepID=A0A4R5MQK0_9SPHI|nr:PqqD family protein [Pedobacter changchengzhani]TDG37685.1 PqqD family protein [Pedobacter changchengzhani]